VSQRVAGTMSADYLDEMVRFVRNTEDAARSSPPSDLLRDER